MNQMQDGIRPDLLLMEDGQLFQETMQKLFVDEVNGAPYFWIAATPRNLNPRLLELDSQEAREVVRTTPGSRSAGWNMAFLETPRRTREGLTRGYKDYAFLSIFENGHMEFWSPLDLHFCWMQSNKEFQRRPRLYPNAVVKYPTTFLRLYEALIRTTSLDSEIDILMCYLNVGGYVLLPGMPGSRTFQFGMEHARPFEESRIQVSLTAMGNFNPDETAYDLIRPLYHAFRLEEAAIPFFDRSERRFIFE